MRLVVVQDCFCSSPKNAPVTCILHITSFLCCAPPAPSDEDTMWTKSREKQKHQVRRATRFLYNLFRFAQEKASTWSAPVVRLSTPASYMKWTSPGHAGLC
jgi:hypothetical protein